MKQQKDHLYKLRHSLAHIMAQAVLQIRPDVKLGFGPPIDTGFYYDFDFGDNPIQDSDLKQIEKRMQKIIKQKQEFSCSVKSLETAVEGLLDANQTYKADYAKELASSGEELSFYVNGSFIDLCEGPHLENTGEVPKGCFSLDKIAGSYWRGSEKNPMLTRIYALCFEDAEALKEFKKMRELARQRDHRKLGTELELFMFSDEVGVGLPLWLPKGNVIREELEKWAKEEEFKAGYKSVSTPSITKGKLYELSGHLPYYKDGMFPPMQIDEGDEYYLRPMICPHHHAIYGNRPRSYRELPYRISEYGDTFRFEKHGSLAGLLRVRSMCMNDAHIYCTREQVAEEFRAVLKMYNYYYNKLRFGDFRVRLSLHDADSGKFVDQEEEWLQSEAMVRKILVDEGVEFEEEAGEAAFYGPKIDIQVKNLLGREETVSTCQLDFIMAERFNLKYTNSEGNEEQPYILHRAPLSTHERFISFLIEKYGGAFPTWMSPVQVQLVPVGDHVLKYCEEIEELLRENLFRVEVDNSSDSFGKKVRKAITSKVPNIWIIGGDEQENRTVAWRRYCGGKEQQVVSLDDGLKALNIMRSERLMDNFDDVALPLEK
ncbi:MAG: threonine--tRNA ligase [Lentisphaeria bacterium]|nr:threonine--tRNA ligase [Lentisphaeria bacterium]